MEDAIVKLRRQPAKTSTSAKTAHIPFEGQPTKVLPISQIIDSYNHHINGIDIGNQLCISNKTDTRVQRGGQQALIYLFLLHMISQLH